MRTPLLILKSSESAIIFSLRKVRSSALYLPNIDNGENVIIKSVGTCLFKNTQEVVYSPTFHTGNVH
jgi:hypothetical protein